MKKFIIGFLLGAIIFSGIGVYAATKYLASEIEFTPTNENWKVNNIEDALNDLYGKKQIILLGSDRYDSTRYYSHQHTYDLLNYSNYNDFTVDNFLVQYNSLQVMKHGTSSIDEGGTITKNYDQSTGILTITLSQSVYQGWGAVLTLDTYLITNK